MKEKINASYVYCILNKVTGNKYVGSTTRISNRKRQHFHELKNGTHSSKLMCEDFINHGKDSFVFFELEEVLTFSRNELLSKEQGWIDRYRPEYNTIENVKKFFPNFSAEAREKSRLAKIGRKQSQEEKDKRAESIRRYWRTHPPIRLSEEKKKHLSEINTGERNPNWGKHRTDETKERTRLANSKIIYTFTHEDGRVVSFYGLQGNSEKFLGISYARARSLYMGRCKKTGGWEFTSSQEVFS